MAAKIKVGDTVKVNKGAKDYNGGKLATFVYDNKYTVKEIKNDRAVISYNNVVVAAVNINDLSLVWYQPFGSVLGRLIFYVLLMSTKYNCNFCSKYRKNIYLQ